MYAAYGRHIVIASALPLRLLRHVSPIRSCRHSSSVLWLSWGQEPIVALADPSSTMGLNIRNMAENTCHTNNRCLRLSTTSQSATGTHGHEVQRYKCKHALGVHSSDPGFIGGVLFGCGSSAAFEKETWKMAGWRRLRPPPYNILVLINYFAFAFA